MRHIPKEDKQMAAKHIKKILHFIFHLENANYNTDTGTQLLE